MRHVAATDIGALVTPQERLEWRAWLQDNHEREAGVWVLYYKVGSGVQSLRHAEAVEEALCFGWIDAKGLSVDETRYKVYFTRRKPGSHWSRVNKERIGRLLDQGAMHASGISCMNRAMADGSWTLLDDAEALVIPSDLEMALDEREGARAGFEAMSRSRKRSLLVNLTLAKRPETRRKRIRKIVAESI